VFGGRYYRRFGCNSFAVANAGPDDPCNLTRIQLIFYNSADFLAATLAGKCLLDALFLSRLQVEGMLFHFFDDVFLLDLPLETP
jgi:hypothetical protein